MSTLEIIKISAIKANFYIVLFVRSIYLNKDGKKAKDETLETKEKTELDGKILHDLYRHATKLIK